MYLTQNVIAHKSAKTELKHCYQFLKYSRKNVKIFSVNFNNFLNENRRYEVRNARKESDLVSFQSRVYREANGVVKNL